MRENKTISLLVLFMILVLAFSPIRATASTSKSQKEVNAAVNTLIKACKKYDVSKVEKCCVDSTKLTYVKDKSWKKLIKKSNSKFFNASIEKISVKKDKATVYLKVTQLTGWNVAKNALKESFFSLNFSPKTLNREIKNYYELFMGDPSEDDIVTYKCKLNYVKIGGKWKVKKANDTLSDIMDGGFSTEMRNFTKNPKKYFEE